MLKRDTLIRSEDGKEFYPILISHWSTIRSEDGEEDCVKCYGPDMYVSSTKGFGYKVKNID